MFSPACNSKPQISTQTGTDNAPLSAADASSTVQPAVLKVQSVAGGVTAVPLKVILVFSAPPLDFQKPVNALFEVLIETSNLNVTLFAASAV